MKAAKGHVFKYGDNVDTDVIIPARYLNSFDAQELATHAMVDIDPTFTQRVQPGDIIVARKSAASSQRHLHVFFIVMPSISDFRSLSVRKHPVRLKKVMR